MKQVTLTYLTHDVGSIVLSLSTITVVSIGTSCAFVVRAVVVWCSETLSDEIGLNMYLRVLIVRFSIFGLEVVF